MTAASGNPDRHSHSPDPIVRELLVELGRAFDLATPLGDETLASMVESRIRSLEPEETPGWGTPGSLTQLAKKGAGALDLYYRPHLFPDMKPGLRLAHRLQFDLLPRHLPKRSPLRIAAVLESYCHLSGDLLGWRMEGEELFLWIADVSGHGVRAGLAAAALYFLIDGVEPGLPPELFAQRVNEAMLEARNPDDPRPLFATAIWMRARADGRIRYASAGHNPALLLRSSGEIERLHSTSVPLGLFPAQIFGAREIELGPNDALCLFTDGLVEATSPEEEEFGLRRLSDTGRQRQGSPLELTREIYAAVSTHRTTTLLEDDLTFLVAERA